MNDETHGTEGEFTDADLQHAEEVINGLVATLAAAIETKNDEKSQQIFNQTAQLVGSAPPNVVVPLFLVLLDKASGLLVDLVASTGQPDKPETSDDL